MHCWQCGQMIQGARCTCGANDTVRPKPKTEYAITLRHVYDVYGQKALLDDPSFFRRILGDAFHDDAGLRNSMRTAIDHGIGGAIKALASVGEYDRGGSHTANRTENRRRGTHGY